MVLHIPEPHIADQELARDIDLHLQPSNLDAATTEGRTRRKTVSNGMASGDDRHPITKETLAINGDSPGRKSDAQEEKAIKKKQSGGSGEVGNSKLRGGAIRRAGEAAGAVVRTERRAGPCPSRHSSQLL